MIKPPSQIDLKLTLMAFVNTDLIPVNRFYRKKSPMIFKILGMRQYEGLENQVFHLE